MIPKEFLNILIRLSTESERLKITCKDYSSLQVIVLQSGHYCLPWEQWLLSSRQSLRTRSLVSGSHWNIRDSSECHVWFCGCFLMWDSFSSKLPKLWLLHFVHRMYGLTQAAESAFSELLKKQFAETEKLFLALWHMLFCGCCLVGLWHHDLGLSALGGLGSFVHHGKLFQF